MMPGPEAVPPAPAPDPEGSPRGAGSDGRLLAALVVGQLGVHSTMAGVRLGVSLQTLREGHGAAAVGVLLALFAAAPVLTALQAGRQADRRGYHALVGFAVVLAMAGAGVAALATLVDGPARLVLLGAAAAACGTSTSVALLTLQRTAGLLARDATERMRLFSWLGVAPSLANVIGPVAVGAAIDLSGFGAGYGLMLLLPLISWFAAQRVPRGGAAAGAAATPARSGGSAWELMRLPDLRRLLLVNWLMSMCWDVHLFAVPLLGHDRGFAASTIGLILGTFTLSVTGVRLLIPLLAHRLGEVQVMRWAMLATALVFAAYPLAPRAWMMGLLAVLLGLALGSVQPMVMSMLHHLTPASRHGEALALRAMALSASSTAMPLLFGATGAVMGAAALFWAVSALVGVGSALPLRIRGG
jgi:MFS family permease